MLITITNDCDFSWNFEYVGEIVSDGYIMKIATNGIINYGADLYTNTVSDIITPASGWTISGAYYYQYGRTAMLLITCYRSSATAAATEVNIGTLKEGKRPIFPACGNLTTGVAMLANVYAAIDGKIYMRFGAQLAASTSVTFGVTYLI